MGGAFLAADQHGGDASLQSQWGSHAC